MQLRWQCAEDPSPRRVLLAGLIPSLAGLVAFVLVTGLAGCSRYPPKPGPYAVGTISSRGGTMPGPSWSSRTVR